ncbi:P-loop NTPase fold protein [Nissabacter sp. SGAir0207]|uniref:KAP family P-loop NTPase fold protein n=1 Tax=Nissabacter sp. SGAir0207 TaxID=2126321 RepID=UPI0010CCD2A6|nr:P-loop NTPase fold protein [Nissabacter sp. SGAir0207]QCR38888.1 hypothetical protein C1N62_22510 [Nissabacter sp. SGAir0207]
MENNAIEIVEQLPFKWDTSPTAGLGVDKLQRSQHAKFLTKFLVNKGKESNYVLNINTGWGGGKTWFLRNWKSEIENKFPTVYIDAWKNDHSKDPFLDVISEIQSSLISKTDKNFFKKPLMSKSWHLVKSLAPDITKALIKKHLAVDIDDLDTVIDGDAFSEISSKIVEKAIDTHKEANQSIEEFKKSISEWLNSVIETSTNSYHFPLFVFIDELDRCRPTYAIEMLETIKHVFDIKGVVFVVATDKEQLQHSIKAIYGEGFNSQLYLDRFFQRTVSLKEISREEFIKEKIYNSNVFVEFSLDDANFIYLKNNNSRIDDIIEFMTIISDGFKMNLRTVTLWYDRVESVLLHQTRPVDLITLLFLMGLYSTSSYQYNRLARGENIFAFLDGNAIVDFKSKNIKLKWSYSQYDSLNEILEEFDGYHNQRIYEGQWTSEIDLAHYISVVLKHTSIRTFPGYRLDKCRDYIFADIKHFIRNNEPSKMSEVIPGPSQADECYSTTFTLMRKFNLDNGLNKISYFEICELATFFE